MAINNKIETYTEYKRCMLCPRKCGVNRLRGQMGFCNATDKVHIARAALHFWEEPLISATAGSGTIFFTNCSLKCVYCQNAQISQVASNQHVGTPKTAADLAETMLALQNQGAININLVTPTHFAPTIRRGINLARSHGLHLPIVWNTSGYESTEAIKANTGLVDIYLTDFKYADTALAQDLSGTPNYSECAIDALKNMVDAVGSPITDTFDKQERLTRGVIVRHLVIPGQIQNSISVLNLLHKEIGNSVMLSIMNQYTPSVKGIGRASASILEKYPDLARGVTVDEYEEVLCVADNLFENGYCYQDGQTCDESFIPEFQS